MPARKHQDKGSGKCREDRSCQHANFDFINKQLTSRKGQVTNEETHGKSNAAQYSDAVQLKP